MKIFFDANFYVSEVAYGGAAERAANGTDRVKWRFLISEFVLGEVERTLLKKLKQPSGRVAVVLKHLRDRCTVVDEPQSRHTVPGDPDDTPILRAAVGAGTDYLVTRDKKILALGKVDSTRIITLAEYLTLLREAGA